MEMLIVVAFIIVPWIAFIVMECEGRFNHKFGRRTRTYRVVSVTKTCDPQPDQDPPAA